MCVSSRRAESSLIWAPVRALGDDVRHRRSSDNEAINWDRRRIRPRSWPCVCVCLWSWGRIPVALGWPATTLLTVAAAPCLGWRAWWYSLDTIKFYSIHARAAERSGIFHNNTKVLANTTCAWARSCVCMARVCVCTRFSLLATHTHTHASTICQFVFRNRTHITR